MDLNNKIQTLEKVGTKNIRLKGKLRSYDTYRIPIKLLKYNRENGRISTFISEYEEKHEINDITEDILEDYIYESSPTENKRTENNIKAMGQIEPAVVMRNGRVIDGNRRFTCLRRLYKKTQNDKFAYITAAILDDEEYSEKDIKKFELQIQNVEEKVAYDHIEQYVDIYKNVLKEPHYFTVEEYAHDSNKTTNEIKKELLYTKLMLSYLEFINKKLKFHYAKNPDISAIVKEMLPVARKKFNDDKNHLVMELCFSAFSSGIVNSKKIRNIISAAANVDVFDDQRQEEAKRLSSAVYKAFNSEGYINGALKDDVSDFVENLIEDSDLSKEKNKDEKLVNLALNNIKKVDKENVYHMSNDYRESFNRKINELKKEVDDLVNIDNA